MSSSFRRGSPRRAPGGSAAAITGRKGTKPWTGGITLTSVGLRDLDAILGGGQPIGTCLLLEEDRWTRDLALCIIKYWCAEAVSHEQILLAPYFHDDNTFLDGSAPSFSMSEASCMRTPCRQGCSTADINSLVDSLPRNLHWDKAAGKVVVEDANTRPLEILEEEEGGVDAEEGLTIAWQYRKSIQDERLGYGKKSAAEKPATSNEYCHSFDLNARLSDQSANRDVVHIVDGKCCENGGEYSKRSCGFRLFQKVKIHVKNQLSQTKNGKLVRLLLYQAPAEAASIAVSLLLAHIRSENLPVVLLVTVQSWTCRSESALLNLRRASDVVMQTEGFSSRMHYPPPAEFRHLHGLLLLPKVSTVTAAAASGGGHFADMTMSKRPTAHVYGLKRDRRKLHMSLLHIPPEDYAGEGGSVGGGGVRSGAGRPKEKATGGCSSSGGNSPLDF